jgi:hypothetical protein
MELELAKSYLAERKAQKKELKTSEWEVDNVRRRKWMKNRGKNGFLDFQDE